MKKIFTPRPFLSLYVAKLSLFGRNSFMYIKRHGCYKKQNICIKNLVSYSKSLVNIAGLLKFILRKNKELS